jgi:hypothetical protein
MNKLQLAEQLRKALQMFAQTLDDEKAMEIATVYPQYEVGKKYKEKEIFTYGTNNVGDPQLYRSEKEHTSQEDWKPDITRSLYTPIGLDNSGYPIWSAPVGGHDSYAKGDIVNHNGILYESLVDGNVWEPGVYGWEVYTK